MPVQRWVEGNRPRLAFYGARARLRDVAATTVQATAQILSGKYGAVCAIGVVLRSHCHHDTAEKEAIPSYPAHVPEWRESQRRATYSVQDVKIIGKDYYRRGKLDTEPYMKILHAANELVNKSNGIVNSAVDLACMQSEAGHDVSFVSSGGGYLDLLSKCNIYYEYANM